MTNHSDSLFLAYADHALRTQYEKQEGHPYPVSLRPGYPHLLRAERPGMVTIADPQSLSRGLDYREPLEGIDPVHCADIEPPEFDRARATRAWTDLTSFGGNPLTGDLFTYLPDFGIASDMYIMQQHLLSLREADEEYLASRETVGD